MFRRWTAASLVTLLGACAGGPRARASDVPMLTLSVEDGRIAPAPDLEIDRYGAICWFNALSPDASFRVVVDRPLGGVDDCATTVNFMEVDGRATSTDVGAAQCAVLCFHETGAFGYVVVGGRSVLRGRIKVR